jgi:hypothetical protein
MLVVLGLSAAYAQDSVMPNSVQQPTPNSVQKTPLPTAGPQTGPPFPAPAPAPSQQIEQRTGSASVTVFSSTGPISTSSGPRVFFSTGGF